MAITACATNQAKQDWFSGLHQPGDNYMCALYTAAASLDATTTAYTATGEASGAGYSAGGQTLTGFAVSLYGNTAQLTWNNPNWTASTLSNVVACMVYNASRSNHSLCILTFTSTSTTDGTFTVVFPTTPGAQTITLT